MGPVFTIGYQGATVPAVLDELDDAREVARQPLGRGRRASGEVNLTVSEVELL